MKVKLTIILTVYNKELYLRRSFEALLLQDGALENDYEILVVNDGSTDNSDLIIDEFARKDSRIRVLTQDNQGLSMARNNGVKLARGEYVWFVDADDTFSRNAVNSICKEINHTPDVIPIYARTDGFEGVRNQIPCTVNSGKEVLLSKQWQQCGVFWIIRRSFLIDNSLSFIPDIYHEDAEFTPRMLYAAKTVRVIPEVLYIVYRDPSSITQVPRPKRAFDYLTVSEKLSHFVVSNKEEGTQIGNAIDIYTALDINNAFFVICQNSEEQQEKFNACFYEKRKALLRVLQSAPHLKYHIEGILFRLFPKRYVSIYKLLKFFDRQ